jgi:hypothetical protein
MEGERALLLNRGVFPALLDRSFFYSIIQIIT